MTRYQGPNRDINFYDCKFVKAGEHLSVTMPHDTSTHHKDLAEGDGIASEASSLLQEGSSEVDAGYLRFETSPHEIWVYGNSLEFNTPASDESREQTAALLERLTPGYTVVALDSAGRFIHRNKEG